MRKATLALTTCAVLSLLFARGLADGWGTKASPRAPADRLALAEQRLVGQCMRERGFEYYTASTGPSSSTPLRQFPYGIDDVAWARANGFGIGLAREDEREGLRRQTKDPNVRYAAGLSEERQKGYQQALFGGPDDAAVTVPLANGIVVSMSTGGCIARAQDRLYGDFPKWFRALTIVDNVPAEVHAMVERDAEYQAALGDWSTCMHRRGHAAKSPKDLAGRFAERVHMDPAGATGAEER